MWNLTLVAVIFINLQDTALNMNSSTSLPDHNLVKHAKTSKSNVRPNSLMDQIQLQDI